MTTDVLRLQGDYQIQTVPGGTLTLNVGSSTNVGTVIVTGNLDVKGRQTTIESINATIRDTTLTLNAGEPTTNLRGGISTNGGLSGIKISRGPNGTDAPVFAAYLEWNENVVWHGTGGIGAVTGAFEFRQGTPSNNPQYSAIKVNKILIDEQSASTAGSGVGQGPRLNFFGVDNPTAVLSVSGTLNYEDRVTDNDDIPNKAYVDRLQAIGINDAKSLIDGLSYLKIIDNFLDGGESTVIAVLDGDPTERSRDPLSGQVVMRLTPTIAQFAEIQFITNEVRAVGANQDLRLAANGTGQVVVAAPLLFETSIVPTPGSGQTGIYADNPRGGGTGMYFVNSSTIGVVTGDEFVSRKKALIYSLIF